MLELKDLWIRYGKKAAVRRLSLSVNKGDFVTILGANGAGKSTTLNAISGLVKVKKGQGEILFKGEKINGLKPGKIAAKGIIQIPEGRKLFPLLTVRENLMMGAYLRKDRKGVQLSMGKALTLFPDLKDKLDDESRELSGGQQQMLAIARGLMADPEVLMLDEPSLGLSPLLRQMLAEKIKEIHQEGVTLILVEQNARLGLMLANYGYVLENGELALQGKTSDLMNDENVKKAYLGV
ncbi:MAG: ABC transporter ATP-binding protein [Thermodesulfobacteriota bacterium]|jgi:branched-chain amino acid transport system ATP-binding protein